MNRNIISIISGILFGLGMNISGMVNPENIIGFLDIFGNWKPELIFVMGGALVVFAPIYHFVIKKKNHAIDGERFSFPKNKKIDKKLIIGATIFGLGWGIGGFCPGPVIASFMSFSPTIFIFFISMVLGMFLAIKFEK
jgi:uncharacterized membrane protein YedE/YeeE